MQHYMCNKHPYSPKVLYILIAYWGYSDYILLPKY